MPRSPQPTMPSRRAIPSLERLLARPALVSLADRFGHDAVLHAARRATEALRTSIASGAPVNDVAALRDVDQVSEWLEHQVEQDLSNRLSSSLRPAINATGA